MKIILVPIDYSDASKNALRYAIEFAKTIDGKILLLHVYEIPMTVSTEMTAFIVDTEALEKENSFTLIEFKKEILNETKNSVVIESAICPGFPVEEILNAATENKVDFIVMGLNGAGVMKKILGSTATAVMKRAQCPVIVVPADAKFQLIKKIVLACDYKHLNNPMVLQPLWELAVTQNAEILVFNVDDSRVHPSSNESMNELKLEHFFGSVKHSYWFGSNENIAIAIDEFVKKHEAVMIAGTRQHHSFPENIFHRSIMNQLAFQARTPLFTLHD